MAKRLTPIKDGPFYGIALSSWILCSITGVNVNSVNIHVEGIRVV